MTEAELQHEVEKLCDELGLLWHHCHDSRHCDGRRGFPDLVIIGPCGLLLAELKSAAGETSSGQDLWLWHLAKIPGPRIWAIWRPADLASGRIRNELFAIADLYPECVNSQCPSFPHRYRRGDHR